MNIREYLSRLKIEELSGSELENLKLIQRSHLEAIPFENFEVRLYDDVSFNEEHLFDKIVRRERGGICYELNYLLYLFLVQMGYDVTILSGCVVAERGTDFDHLLLKVKVDGTFYLVDVGFGDNFYEPLLFEVDLVQKDVKGSFRVIKDSEERYTLERKVDGEFTRSYAFNDIERHVGDFEDRKCWYCTAKESTFRKQLFCSIEQGEGRVSMKPGKVILTRNGSRSEVALESFEDFEEALEKYFGLRFVGEEKVLLRGIYEG